MNKNNIKKIEEGCINICMICDDGYIMPTSVAIQSIKDCISSDRKCHIYIITSNISRASRRSLSDLADSNVSITVINDNANARFSDFHVFEKDSICVATLAALLKFVIPDLLPDIDKVLYLDGDLIVRNSLEQLFDTDIEDYYAAAVIDSGSIYYKHEYVKLVEHYFNSGVMLLNLKNIRKDNLVPVLIETKKNMNNNNLMDQNVFNVVFDKKIKLLPIKFNFMPVSLSRAEGKWTIDDINKVYDTKYPSEKKMYTDASIIHYSSKDKPWKTLDGVFSYYWTDTYMHSGLNDTYKLIEKDNSAHMYGISVIIPCYNVENYLRQTVSSILDQEFKDFEIIFIDDGSTDSTLEIIKGFSKLNPDIQIISDSNHGQGYQRNVGISRARGKYIYFMDSDDLLQKNCFRNLFALMENNRLDLVFFEGTSFYESEDLEQKFPQYKEAYNRKKIYPRVYNGEEIYNLLRKNGEFIVSPCLQMVRREYIQQNNICFPKIKMYEDNFYVFSVTLNANRVMCIPDIYFYRRVRNNSTMTAACEYDKIISWSEIIKETTDTLTDFEYGTETYKTICEHIKRYLMNLSGLMRKVDYKSFEEKDNYRHEASLALLYNELFESFCNEQRRCTTLRSENNKIKADIAAVQNEKNNCLEQIKKLKAQNKALEDTNIMQIRKYQLLKEEYLKELYSISLVRLTKNLILKVKSKFGIYIPIKVDKLNNIHINSQKNNYNYYRYSKLKANTNYSIKLKGINSDTGLTEIDLGIYNIKSKKFLEISSFEISKMIEYRFTLGEEDEDIVLCIFAGKRGHTKDMNLSINNIIVRKMV